MSCKNLLHIWSLECWLISVQDFVATGCRLVAELATKNLDFFGHFDGFFGFSKKRTKMKKIYAHNFENFFAFLKIYGKEE
jgi:hypothetical protein